jgi:hypothetical protein
MNSEKKLLVTMTGEIYQPIRVYYRLFDKKAVIKRFSKLRCMDFDRAGNRWVWLYYGEAKKLKFKKPYSSLSKKAQTQPIIIGSFFIRKDNEMFLDLYSFERATKAIVFFDKYIKRSAAKITHVAIVNKVFSSSTVLHPTLDIFFNSDKVVERNPDDLIKEIEEIKLQGKNLDDFFKKLKEQRPEVEKFPIHFYEEGIEGLQFSLLSRQGEAVERWKSNKNS